MLTDSVIECCVACPCPRVPAPNSNLGINSREVGFLAITWLALESGGVGIVETTRADGTLRRTHVWPARIDGGLWLEAGTAGNGWYLDVQQEPLLWLDYEGERTRYRAYPVRDPAAHDRLRASLREQFGWRDPGFGWVGTVWSRREPS